MKHGSMTDDAEYLPLSWLSQVSYCSRRAALLMNERAWEENPETAKGRAEHDNVHNQRSERRRDKLKLYEYTVYSDSMMLTGKCDCVEAERSPDGYMIPAADFPVTLYPVEFKHGSVREEEEYMIQLCAQAMCLEEMYGASITDGAIFYITAHRRQTVVFSDELRNTVKEKARLLREIRCGFIMPKPEFGPKCKRCSLCGYCMPKVKTSALRYCMVLAQEAKEDEPL